jgi:hypothetical protein
MRLALPIKVLLALNDMPESGVTADDSWAELPVNVKQTRQIKKACAEHKPLFLVGDRGIEPRTNGLRVRCSTS